MAGAIKPFLSIYRKNTVTPHLSNGLTSIIYTQEDSHDPESGKGVSQANNGHETHVRYSTREQ